MEFGQRPKHAHLEPLARLDRENVQLLALPGGGIQAFPKRGRVIWFNSYPETDLGVHYFFQVRESPTFDSGKPNSDRYTVDSNSFLPQEVDEIFNGVGTRTELRERFARTTVDSLMSPNRAYAQLSSSEIAGPIPFARGEHGLRLDISRLDELPLNVYRYPGSCLKWRTHVLTPPNWDRGGRLRQIDWAGPEKVLVRTLRLLKQFDKQHTEDMEFSRAALQMLEDRINDYPLSSLERQRLETSRIFLDGLQSDNRIAKAYIQHIATLPKFKEDIEAKLKEQEETILEDARKQAAELVQHAKSEVSAIESRRQDLVQEIGKQQTELASLESKVATARRELAQAVERDAAAVQAALETRLLEIADQPHAWLANIAVLKAGLGPQLVSAQMARGTTVTRPRLMPVIQQAWHEHGNPIEDIKGLHRTLRRAVKSQDVTNRVLAAALTGTVPVFSGSDSLATADIFARSVAADRVIRVGIAPGWTTPAQLFLDSRPGEPVVPAAHGLMDALLYAQQHDGDLMVIILEGVNRSAIDLYLLPILHLYSGDRPFLPLFRPELAEQCDGFAGLGTLRWPANVLMIATEADEVHELAALPIPPSVWGYTAHVPATAKLLSMSRDPALTEVPTPLWRQWGTCSDAPNPIQQEIEGILEALEECFLPVAPVAVHQLRRCASLSSKLPGIKQQDLVALWLARPIMELRLEDAKTVLEAHDVWPADAAVGGPGCTRN